MAKIVAQSSAKSYPELVKMESEGLGEIICWKNEERVCQSDCAAWDIQENPMTVRCKALPFRIMHCL